MDSVQIAKAISMRESQSELLLDLALQAQEKSQELSQSSQAQTAELVAAVGDAKDTTAQAVAQLMSTLEQLPEKVASQALTALKLELAEMTGAFSQRLEVSASKALNGPISEAQADLEKLQARASSIELPSADKKVLSFVAAAVAAAVVFAGVAGFATARLFPPKNSVEFQRQIDAGADLLRVWGDLPNATRDDLIKRFSKR